MDIQNLIFMVIMPIVCVADILRRNNSQTQEIKSLLYTTLTLLGQIQYHLSLQRRYMNRPLFKKIYSRLYSDDVPHLSRKLGWGHIFAKTHKNSTIYLKFIKIFIQNSVYVLIETVTVCALQQSDQLAYWSCSLCKFKQKGNL